MPFEEIDTVSEVALKGGGLKSHSYHYSSPGDAKKLCLTKLKCVVTLSEVSTHLMEEHLGAFIGCLQNPIRGKHIFLASDK